MHPAIGLLSSGKCYSYVNGYHMEPIMGTLAEVEAALGIRSAAPSPEQSAPITACTYTVTLTFQYPAWDEVNGIQYREIRANSRSEANAIARSMADRDGHLCSGKGRYFFKAAED